MTGTSDTTGNVTSNATSDMTSDATGNVTSNVASDATGDATSNATSNVASDTTSDATGSVTSSRGQDQERRASASDRPIALVTGATSGIGRAAAVRLAAEGFEVLVHGRDAERGARVVEEIEKDGGRARFLAADLDGLAAVARLAEAAADAQVLVNNAGFAWFGPSPELPADTFDALFAANVRATYYLTAALAPKMAARGKGSIVNVGSMAGQIGMPGGAAYGATKAALASLTRSWAAEFSPSGVRVNTVAPGPVYTGVPPERTAATGRTTLLARAAEAAEIAEAIAFVASDRGSYLTGSVLSVDGGRTAV